MIDSLFKNSIRVKALTGWILALIACNDVPQAKVDYDQFGHISRKTEYLGSSNRFRATEYFLSGKTKSIRYYKNEQQDGQCISYYPSGIRKQSGHYKEGRLHGPDSSFSQSGILVSCIEYLDGKKNGRSIKYHPDGSIKFEAVYKDDILESVNGMIIPDQK